MKNLERLARLITLDTVLEDAGETLSQEAIEAMIGLEIVLDEITATKPDIIQLLDTAIDSTELVLYLVPLLIQDMKELIEKHERGEILE